MAYKKYIDCHRDYINNTTQFAITGIHPDAMFYEIESEDGTYTPYYTMLHNEAIDAIIPTATTNSKGTWLVISDKTKLREATTFFDQEIDIIYRHIPDDPHFQFEDTIPIRIQKQRFATSSFMVARSEFLDKLIPSTIEIPSDTKPNANTSDATVKNQSDNMITTKRKAAPNSSNIIQKQKLSHWQSTAQSTNGNSSATLVTTTTRDQEIEEKMLQHVNNLEEKIQKVTKQMDQLQASNKNRTQELETHIKQVDIKIQESNQNHTTSFQQLKVDITQMEQNIKLDVSRQISTGFQNQSNDMQDLKRRFDFLCKHLSTNTNTENPSNNPVMDKTNPPINILVLKGTTDPITHTPTENKTELVTANDRMDTPTQSAIRKPAYATPVNKWYQPKKSLKSKHKLGKKISDKNEKVNKQLTNFFAPLEDKTDECEHPMMDATDQK
jgi:hypothetical protein